MSHQLPIGNVLNEAFQFGWRRWATVLRFVWLPVLLSILAGLAYVFVVIDLSALEALEDPAELFDFENYMRLPPAMAALLGAAVYAFFFLLFSGFMASLFRLAALGEERPGVFQLRIDGPAFRVFWAILILSLLGLAIWTAAFFAALAITGQTLGVVVGALRDFFALAMAAAESGDELAPSQLEIIAEPFKVLVLTIALGVIPLVYMNIRLAPFVAGSAAENRLLLFGALDLTKGRFWSIFTTLLLMVLLLSVVVIAVEIVLGIFELLAQMFVNMGGASALVGAVIMSVYAGATIIYQAFLTGVQLSVQAIIYRRLKTGA